MRKILGLTLILILTSCSTIGEQHPDVPKAVADMQVSFALLSDPATAYLKRPVCGKTTAIICRDPKISKQIIAYGRAVITGIDAARLAEDETTLSAAQTMLDAYKNFSNILPKEATP